MSNAIKVGIVGVGGMVKYHYDGFVSAGAKELVSFKGTLPKST